MRVLLIMSLLSAAPPLDARAQPSDDNTVSIAVDPLATIREGVVGGTAVARCTQAGTVLRLNLSGLVPRGTYSLWLFVFGVDREAISPADASGAGALGAGRGASHEFLADPEGRADLIVVQPPGPLSAFGRARPCLLDEPHWRLVGGYHPRRVVAGTAMPPGGEIVAHFGVRSTAALAGAAN